MPYGISGLEDINGSWAVLRNLCPTPYGISGLEERGLDP